MKKITLFKKRLLGVLLLLTGMLSAQNITLSIENAQITNDGSNDYYEADIMISSDADYVQGSGQFFLDYNTAAFGSSVQGSGAITFERPLTSILGTQTFGVDNYNSFVVNDNTGSKVSYLWQQFWSGGTIGANNVTGTPALLVHVKIRYVDSNEMANVCFDTTSNASFDDQFFTACGPGAGPPAGADCGGAPGTQIMNYTPDCTNAEPVPLSIADEGELAGLRLFPNPVSNTFQVSGLSTSVTLQVFDLNGKLLINEVNYNGAPVVVEVLSQGLYLVKMTTSDAQKTIRLLKE